MTTTLLLAPVFSSMPESSLSWLTLPEIVLSEELWIRNPDAARWKPRAFAKDTFESTSFCLLPTR